MFNRLLGRFSEDIGIDFGTSNTRIFVKERGIVLNEPSIVAVNTRSNQMIAVGRSARDMVGKTPPHITTTRPLAKGVISDFEIAEKMLKYFLDHIHEESFTIVPRPKVIIGVPLEMTEVERKAVEDASFSAGAREVSLVEGIITSALGARLPISDSLGSMVVDIGGGKTEIAVISLNGVVTWKALSIAGDELTKNIMHFARDVFNLLIGDRVAETTKHTIGSAIPLDQTGTMEVRGRDLITGLPKEILLNDGQVREAIYKSLRHIVENIKSTLEATPPELVADIYEKGIVLTGGGALLRGLDRLIAKEADIPVHVADDPLTCAVRGAGVLIEDQALLRHVTLPSTTDERYT